MSGELLSKVKVGLRAVERGDLAAARAAFEEAIKANDKDWEAWLGLGRVLLATGQDGPARKAYEKVIAIVPNNGEAASQVALLRARQGDEKAMDDLIALTKAKDAGFYAYFNLGKVLGARQDWPGARRAYERALELEPKSPFPYVELAQIAVEQKDLPRAVQQLERASELDPLDWQPVYMLARARILQGEVGQASLLLLKAIRLAPHQEMLRADMVKVCLAAQNTKGALVAAEELFGEFPDSLQTFYLYGIALMTNGRGEDAKSVLEEGLQKAKKPEEAAPFRALLDELEGALKKKKS